MNPSPILNHITLSVTMGKGWLHHRESIDHKCELITILYFSYSEIPQQEMGIVGEVGSLIIHKTDILGFLEY